MCSMKKISCLILLSFAAINVAHGQFYFKAGLGYALPQSGQTMDGTSTPYNGTMSISSAAATQTYSIKSASFSTGVHGFLGIGYFVNDHVGIELNGDFGLSTKKYTFTISNIVLNGVESDIKIEQKAKGLFVLSPSLVLQTGGEVVNLYTRLGVALPLGSKINADQVQSNLPGTGAPASYDFSFQVKNSFSPGFSAAAGLRYKLNDKISIWGEISVLSLNMYIKQSELKDFSYNGQSQSLTYVTSPHVVKYSKNAIVDSNQASLPTYSQPFSNVGLNVGVSFNISEKKQKRNDHLNSDEAVEEKKPYKRR